MQNVDSCNLLSINWFYDIDFHVINCKTCTMIRYNQHDKATGYSKLWMKSMHIFREYVLCWCCIFRAAKNIYITWASKSYVNFCPLYLLFYKILCKFSFFWFYTEISFVCTFYQCSLKKGTVSLLILNAENCSKNQWEQLFPDLQE